MTTKCPRKLLAYYLSDKLDVDDQLIFFAHLDTCPECWDEVYKTKSRLKMSDKEIKQFEHKERAIEVA